MRRSGHADLPLHYGRLPVWLAERMTLLGTAITEAVIYEYGRPAFLSRLSDPWWFQAFGAVMGMDWHSSGITTTVLGTLKRGVNPKSHELGIRICGGRGRASRNTPNELRDAADTLGLDGEQFVQASRLTARVDNNAVGDGFQIYMHAFVLSDEGEWAVVQQGLNEQSKLARRYHWHSATVKDFVTEPHTAIVGENQGTIMNLVDARAHAAQHALVELSRENPERTLAEVQKLILPSHHDVRAKDVDLKRLGAVLAVAYERQLHDFASLLLTQKLGPRTLQSLALVAEVIHGTPTRFRDPARFAFAHGGKDGHPFPVPLKTYDESIGVLRRALDSAKVGQTEKIEGFKRLDAFVRLVEERARPEADFDAVMTHEQEISPSLDGRTVFDDHPAPKRLRKPKQGLLFE